jgi:lysophospholipase L1-like esterase
MLRRWIVLMVTTLTVVAYLSGSAAYGASNGTGTRSTSRANPAQYYLALGDSVPVANFQMSYPYLIVNRHPHRQLQLVNMACSGETTGTMLDGALCPEGGSQYQSALTFLDSHHGSVALITIDIGGNDVGPCIDAADVQTCVANALTTMESNLTLILAGLRSAAGPQVPIVGMNYFNPILGDWLSPSPSDQTLVTESIAGIQLLNSDLEQLYTEAGAKVADVFDAFDTSEMSTLTHSKWGMVPVAVKKACTLLNFSCQKGEPEGLGDDPNAAGAVVIAHAFAKVIRLRSAS